MAAAHPITSRSIKEETQLILCVLTDLPCASSKLTRQCCRNYMKERYPVTKYNLSTTFPLLILFGCTRQIGLTHRISCGWLLDVSACVHICVHCDASKLITFFPLMGLINTLWTLGPTSCWTRACPVNPIKILTSWKTAWYSTETDQNRKCTRLNKPKNIWPRKTSFLLVLASVPWWWYLGQACVIILELG